MRTAGLMAALALAALGAAGCVSVGGANDAPARAYLQLHDDARVQALATPLVAALLIQPQPADALADTVSIAYTRAPNEFGFYQFAAWTERPVRSLPRLLQHRLEARGVAGAVGQLGDPLRADWLLALHIDTLHHDAAASPGQARLALRLELFDRRDRTRRGAAQLQRQRARSPRRRRGRGRGDVAGADPGLRRTAALAGRRAGAGRQAARADRGQGRRGAVSPGRRALSRARSASW